MKHTLILIISTLILTSCAIHKPQGVYYDEISGSFACIQQDSIAIGYKRTPLGKQLLYYYGNYALDQRKVILSQNMLRFENMTIEEEYSVFSGIEIQLYEQQPFLVLGAPTTVDSTYLELANHCEVYLEYDSLYHDVFTGRSKANAITTDVGLIQIPMDALTMDSNNMVDLFILGCANFFSEVRIVAKPHVRYVIKQKSLYHRLMIPRDVSVEYNARKNLIKITESGSINYQPKRTFRLKYIGPADSCLGELRRRYPDL